MKHIVISLSLTCGILFLLMISALQRAAVVQAREEALLRLHDVELSECKTIASNCDDALVTCVSWQAVVEMELRVFGALLRRMVP